MRIIGIGDNVCDVYVDKACMYPGGQALNVAAFASILGVQAAYMGVFGDDLVAAHVRGVLRELQVEEVRCRAYPQANGYALVTHASGERIFMGSNRGGPLREHPLAMNAEDLHAIAPYTLLHTSNNSYLDGALARLARLPARVSYDFSGAWRDAPRAKEVCPYLDFAFLSLQREERPEMERIAAWFHRQGVRHLVMTMGSEGAWYSAGEGLLHQPPHTVQAVDTLGAGDSFAAAFLCETIGGAKPQDALDRAARFSAQCCLMHGAFGHGAPVPKALLRKMKAEALPPQRYGYTGAFEPQP